VLLITGLYLMCVMGFIVEVLVVVLLSGDDSGFVLWWIVVMDCWILLCGRLVYVLVGR